MLLLGSTMLLLGSTMLLLGSTMLLLGSTMLFIHLISKLWSCMELLIWWPGDNEVIWPADILGELWVCSRNGGFLTVMEITPLPSPIVSYYHIIIQGVGGGRERRRDKVECYHTNPALSSCFYNADESNFNVMKLWGLQRFDRETSISWSVDSRGWLTQPTKAITPAAVPLHPSPTILSLEFSLHIAIKEAINHQRARNRLNRKKREDFCCRKGKTKLYQCNEKEFHCHLEHKTRSVQRVLCVVKSCQWVLDRYPMLPVVSRLPSS